MKQLAEVVGLNMAVGQMELLSTPMAMHYKVKGKQYDPLENRHYRYQKQPVKQDRERKPCWKWK